MNRAGELIQEIFDPIEVSRTGAESFGSESRVLAEREHALDTGRFGVCADARVHTRGVVTELAHVAENKEARARGFGEDVERRTR